MEPELERLRVKAAAKVREFLLQRFYGLRKPKTNIQILQQNVLLKFKYFVKFLQQHGQEVFPEVRTAYVEMLSRIYRSALCTWGRSVGVPRGRCVLTPRCAAKYVIALNQLQVDVAGKHDVLGANLSALPPASPSPLVRATAGEDAHGGAQRSGASKSRTSVFATGSARPQPLLVPRALLTRSAL